MNIEDVTCRAGNDQRQGMVSAKMDCLLQFRVRVEPTTSEPLRVNDLHKSIHTHFVIIYMYRDTSGNTVLSMTMSSSVVSSSCRPRLIMGGSVACYVATGHIAICSHVVLQNGA